MQFIVESKNIADYLVELDEVNFSHPVIQEQTAQLFTKAQTKLQKAQIAFEFVRDEVSHSWDIQSERVTCKASDVLLHHEGICYTKSHLLAALFAHKVFRQAFAISV